MNSPKIPAIAQKAEAVVTVTEMTEVDCQFISIVERGANRIPFKVLKSDGDSPMINLSTLFASKKKADNSKPAQPIITGVMVRKSADSETLRAALKCNGIDTAIQTVKKADDHDIVQYGVITGSADEHAIKITDDVVLICKGIDWSAVATTFDDYMSLNMYSSLSTACSTLQDVVWAIVYDAKDKASLEVGVGKAVDDFASYVKSIVGKIPENVVKMEIAIYDANLEQVAKGAEVVTEAAPTPAPEVAPVVEPAPTPTPEVVAEVAPAPEAAPVAVEKSDDIATIIQKALQPLVTQLNAVQESVNTVQKLESSVQSLKTELQVVSNVAKSANEAVKGKVTAPATSDPVASPVAKSDCENEVSDTAFSSTRKKVL